MLEFGFTFSDYHFWSIHVSAFYFIRSTTSTFLWLGSFLVLWLQPFNFWASSYLTRFHLRLLQSLWFHFLFVQLKATSPQSYFFYQFPSLKTSKSHSATAIAFTNGLHHPETKVFQPQLLARVLQGIKSFRPKKICFALLLFES